MLTEETLDWFGGPCWFCKRAAPVEGSSSVFRVDKMVAPGEILHSSVSVPRCESCRAGHRRVDTIAGAIALAGAVAVGALIVPADLPVWGKVIGVVLGAGPGAMLLGGGVGLPDGIQSEKTGVTYPGVLEMVRCGWILPDTTQQEQALDAVRRAAEAASTQAPADESTES